MLKPWLLFFGVVLATCGAMLTSSADDTLPPNPGRRIALVIGNANYSGLDGLLNPINDATDVAASLKGFGFEVALGIDLKQIDMERMISRFAGEARQAATAL